MLIILFVVLMIGVFGKLLVFAIKGAWGITKILFSIVFLPLVLIGIAISGFLYIAIIAVFVIGIISLIKHI